MLRALSECPGYMIVLNQDCGMCCHPRNPLFMAVMSDILRALFMIYHFPREPLFCRVEEFQAQREQSEIIQLLSIIIVLKTEICHDANFVITGGTTAVPPVVTKLTSWQISVFSADLPEIIRSLHTESKFTKILKCWHLFLTLISTEYDVSWNVDLILLNLVIYVFIFICDLCHHWFRWWLVCQSAPSVPTCTNEISIEMYRWHA